MRMHWTRITLKTFFTNTYHFYAEKKFLAPKKKPLAVIRTQGLATHVAIYAGDGNIIHTMLYTGTVCERLSSPMLKGRVEGWYRVSKGYCTDKSVLPG